MDLSPERHAAAERAGRVRRRRVRAVPYAKGYREKVLLVELGRRQRGREFPDRVSSLISGLARGARKVTSSLLRKGNAARKFVLGSGVVGRMIDVFPRISNLSCSLALWFFGIAKPVILMHFAAPSAGRLGL